MIVTTVDSIPDRKIARVVGIVKGSTVRAKHIGRDFMAGLKGIVGGEISGYTELMNEARDQAVDRMIQDANELNAEAIVNVRFTTSMIAPNMAELLAYGTAVKLYDPS